MKTSTDPCQQFATPLSLPIFDKTRIVALHLKCNKKTTVTVFYQIEKSESAHDFDSLHTITNDDCH